ASEQARQVDAAREAGRPAEPLSTVQRKTLELADKLTEFRKLVAAFGSPRLGSSRDEIGERLAAAREQSATLDRAGAARAIPPISLDDTWQTVYGAELDDLRRWAGGQPRNDAVEAFARLTAAYAGGDAGAFSAALAKMESAAERYESAITDAGSGADLAIAERLDTGKVRFEGFFNAFSPFYLCAAMYVVAFVLTASGWLARAGGRAWAPLLGRSAMAVLCVTLAVHTFALVARVYISGRPPVTNLYSSAVFIGWAGVLLGVAFEAIYRLGIGSAVSAVLGFATLVVAHYLSLDGDTFTVLQAVLDTQFWLATHVVCVTLGYATVLLAGFLGIAYLAADCAPRWLGQKSAIDKRAADQLTRMTYGTVCFALFFSFIGTVLGGLWADDSWGRFWGWDPKENGALIIVLWNALVLHARWGKMIGPRGLAMLAVGGNMVTTWSWFGVNELGVGLHAYGASDSPTAVYLAWFCASQLAVIAAAAVTPSGSRSAATA
ncbi:MAG: cytochrome c biogenesis protein CcsA, partial [Planctomycetota bacterium]